MISLKTKIKTILTLGSEIMSNKIPTNKDGMIDMDKFRITPEFQAVIVFLKGLKINEEWLSKNGFMAAMMIYGPELN